VSGYHERIKATIDREARYALRTRAIVEAAHSVSGAGKNAVTATTSNGKHSYEWARVERAAPNEIRVYPVGAPPGSDTYVSIVNPPILVRDPGGPIDIHGERFREDPLAALADIMHEHRSQIAMEAPPWR
jgi:hypothetical protein